MNYLALGNHIVVVNADNEKLSEGGLILTDGKAQCSFKRSRVVSISEKLSEQQSNVNHQRPIRVGDIVVHAYHIGTILDERMDKVDKTKTVEYRAIHIDNVVAIELQD